MYNPKILIEKLNFYVEEINKLLEESKKIVNRVKLESDKEKVEQYIKELKLLPETYELSANHIQKGLSLESHPEGGYFKEFIRTSDYTVIFYLLPKGEVSTWHALKNTQETFELLSGDPLSLPFINPNGNWETEKQLTYTNSVVIKKGEDNKWGSWFGAYPLGSYSLVICRCIPAFEYENFKLAEKGDIAILREKNPIYLEIINKLTPKNILTVLTNIANTLFSNKSSNLETPSADTNNPRPLP